MAAFSTLWSVDSAQCNVYLGILPFLPGMKEQD